MSVSGMYYVRWTTHFVLAECERHTLIVTTDFDIDVSKGLEHSRNGFLKFFIRLDLSQAANLSLMH